MCERRPQKSGRRRTQLRDRLRRTKRKLSRFAKNIAALALENNVTEVEALLASNLEGQPVSTALTSLISTIGENIKIRRIKVLTAADNQFIASYKHMGGKITTLVKFNGTADESAQKLGCDLAMHVTASSPRFLDRSEVGPEELEQEKELARNKLQKRKVSPKKLSKRFSWAR